MTMTTEPTGALQPDEDNAAPIRQHPLWCERTAHEQDQADYPAEKIPHVRFIADGWMFEVQRLPGVTGVTRPAGGSWGVRIEQDGPDGCPNETVIVLRAPSEAEERFLPGEARELAAALIRAADLTLFYPGA